MSLKKDLGLIVLALGMTLSARDTNINYNGNGIDASFSSGDKFYIAREGNQYVAKNDKQFNLKTSFNVGKVKDFFTKSDREKVLKKYYSDVTSDIEDIVEYKIDVRRPRRSVTTKSIYFPKQFTDIIEKLAVAYTTGGVYFRGNDLVNQNGLKASYGSVGKESKDKFFEYFLRTYSSDVERNDKAISIPAVEKMLNNYKY